jgi:hypothetical protein
LGPQIIGGGDDAAIGPNHLNKRSRRREDIGLRNKHLSGFRIDNSLPFNAGQNLLASVLQVVIYLGVQGKLKHPIEQDTKDDEDDPQQKGIPDGQPDSYRHNVINSQQIAGGQWSVVSDQ